jgi:hypothetical protein
MTNYTTLLLRSTLALLAGAYFMTLLPSKASANTVEDSQEISKLLAEAKSEAIALRDDADRMATFTRSKLSWGTFAAKLDEIKEHINTTGELLAKLDAARESGSSWQQQAIDHIRPVLKELATNTEATYAHLNDNERMAHNQELVDYCDMNYRLAEELAALVGDFVNYGEAKARFAELQKKVAAR